MEDILGQGLWQNGPKPGAFYNFPGKNMVQMGPAKVTLSPMVTGTSVLAVKFDGGIILAADTLGSYGSLARYRNCSRVMKVNDSTVLGVGGDYADYQYIKAIVEQRVIDEECLNDGFQYTPKALFSWLTRVMYNRRSKFDPLWNTCIVGGVQDGEPFLGYVDKIGTAYQGSTLASGFGAYLALPLMREAYEKNNKMTEAEAKQLIEKCLKVLFYRDARSLNRYELAVVTKDGSRVEGPFSAETDWSLANLVKGYE